MKKQKKTVIVTILLIGSILCGCSQSSDLKGKDDSDNIPDKVSKEQPDSMAAYDDVTVQSEMTLSYETNAAGNIAELNTQLFNGEEGDMWYGNNHKLVIKKDTVLYLYDVKTGEVVSRTDTEVWNEVEIYPYDKGYCVIGAIGDSASGKENRLCIFYDERLEEINRISLNEIVDDVIFTSFAVSADGSKLAYSNFEKGLNVYDFETGSVKQLINIGADTSYENRKNILLIDAVYFGENGEELVFSAQTDKNQVTYESWGRIKIDGGGLENYILDKNPGTAITYKKGKLLFGEDSLTFGGVMGYVDVKDQTQAYSTDIQTGSAVGGPMVSQNGEYFGVTQLQDKNVKISIYRTEDLSMVYQETITDDNEEYFYRIPRVYLFDELKAGIICLGGHSDIPLKAVLIDFGE